MEAQSDPGQPPVDRPRFEIGLVMAGAISAGAYTAGVIDFLLEALSEWYKKYDGNPPHDIKIRVVSGASAGGMVGAILTASLGAKIPPIRPDQTDAEKALNPLYRSWVQDVDIKYMLEAEDLGKDKALKSLLDCTKLEQIAKDAITVKLDKTRPMSERWPFISDPFDLYLSVSNLRGVPYSVPLKTGAEGRAGHYMSAHAEAMHFTLSETCIVSPNAIELNPAEYPSASVPLSGGSENGWVQLANAALATGAFPFGLAPRELKRKRAYYSGEMWPVTMIGKDGEPVVEHRHLNPNWPSIGDDYVFTCVDGGVMNNEPLELARTKLVENRGERMERDGYKATRAVILVDPFPGGPTFDPKYKEPENLVKVAGALFGSLISQARFKPDELLLAMDDNIYSRFLIAPSRAEKDKDQSKSVKSGDKDMASGALGGFGGFLDIAFRHHDFMLGRRNCQYFLKKSFTLPAEDEKLDWDAGNPLFSNWKRVDAHIEDHIVAERDSLRQLPIIPCVGTAKDEVGLPAWPKYTEKQLDTLTGQIKQRISTVGESLIDQYFGRRGLMRLAAKFALWFEKERLAKRARAAVKADFGPDGHNFARE